MALQMKQALATDITEFRRFNAAQARAACDEVLDAVEVRLEVQRGPAVPSLLVGRYLLPLDGREVHRNILGRARRGHGRKVTPPSTLIVWAVMKLPSSESSRALSAAMSSGLPKRDLTIWRARVCSTMPSGIGFSSNL